MAKQQAMLRASQYYWVDFKKVLVHPPSSRMLSLGHLCDELTGGQFETLLENLNSLNG